MFKELYHEIKYYINVLEYPVLCVISTFTPIMCFIIGKKQLHSNDIGIIVCIFLFQFVIYMNKRMTGKRGKGNEVPVPSKRFSYVSEDGEVSIDTTRLQELILYIGDLEDYLERKGKL